MIILLIGVPGVGKTTIAKELEKSRNDVKIVNFGDVMFEIAKEKYGIENRDEMRKKIPVSEYENLQIEAAKKIAKIKEKFVLVDTHLVIKKPEGYFPGTSNKIAEILKPKIIVLIETLPKEIIERRKNDPTRKRDEESEEDIEFHQQLNRMYAVTISNLVGCAIKIIDFRYPQKFPFEHTRRAVEELEKLFNKLNS